MPRKAPDKVIEHRISLSNFERSKIMEELERTRTNKLYSAGIGQVGQIFGSGVLLWGIGAYLGYGLFSTGFNKVSDVVNNVSSGLASFLNPEGQGDYSDAEANRVQAAFNTLDAGIFYHREADRANVAASNGAIARLQRGEITYAEFQVEYIELRKESDRLTQLQFDIGYARDVVTYIRNEFNNDRGGIPSWFDAPLEDLIEACKGYPTEGTPLTYPDTSRYLFANGEIF